MLFLNRFSEDDDDYHGVFRNVVAIVVACAIALSCRRHTAEKERFGKTTTTTPALFNNDNAIWWAAATTTTTILTTPATKKRRRREESESDFERPAGTIQRQTRGRGGKRDDGCGNRPECCFPPKE